MPAPEASGGTLLQAPSPGTTAFASSKGAGGGAQPWDAADAGGNFGGAPEEIDFAQIMELMTSRYTVELVDRHVAALRKICKTCCNGFLLKHLEPLVDLLRLTVKRLSEGFVEFAPAISDFCRVASQPFVSCKASDMITYGQHLPAFIKVLVSVLQYTLPPAEETPRLGSSGGVGGTAGLAGDESQGTADHQAPAAAMMAERRATFERLRIEVAHSLACWSRFGLDENVETAGNKPLIEVVADSGTPNLRILRQSQVMDALSASFRAEDSPEAIVITLGAIRDMSLYRPLARQITNCGLISNLVHVIRVNLLGSDVLLVAAEVLWNVLELDWEGAAEALGQADVIESFRDFMDAVLAKGYRFKDKIFRNDMMVLLMYISKRPENRTLFASTGLMALLLSYAVSEEQRKELKETGVLEEVLEATYQGAEEGSLSSKGTVALTNSQEDMEFRMLLWSTLARCCSAEDCAQVAVRCGLVPSLLSYLDEGGGVPPDQRQWSQEQRRKVQLESLSALFQLVQYVPDAFMEAQGSAVLIQLLQATRSREVQRKSLHVLQVAVRKDPHFAEELCGLGAVGLLVELFADRDNPMGSRQLCASVLAGLCAENADNRREFRKKDGIEALREEVVYRPDQTTDNHLFYTLCVVDCVWCAIVGTRKNEIRFLDAGGLFALLDVLEVAPLLLKRQIIGCLADLMQYRKAAKLFVQWNSQVTMKGALKILLELWQREQEAAGSTGPEGVILDLDRPLNLRGNAAPMPENSGELSGGPSMDNLGERQDSRGSQTSFPSSRASGRLRHACTFAKKTNELPSKPKQQTSTNSLFTNGSANSTVRSQDDRQDAAAIAAAAGEAADNLGNALADHQDCRAKIYAVLNLVGFECQEALSIAERQQMELVKLYPSAVQLETWIQVQENLVARGVKPISADQKWIDDSIEQFRDQASAVQGTQRKLADERRAEEEAGLSRFYDDVRGRAQFRRLAPGPKDHNGALDDGGYPSQRNPNMPAAAAGNFGASSGDETP
jgi:hypothetical protein